MHYQALIPDVQVGGSVPFWWTPQWLIPGPGRWGPEVDHRWGQPAKICSELTEQFQVSDEIDFTWTA